MSSGNRPLSPHLQVYRWQITMVMSILHRFTGVVLSLGSLVLVYWLVSLASGEAAYARAAALLGAPLGLLILVALSLAFFYHLCNGVRHLLWDTGWGFEIQKVYASGWTTAAATVVLTLGFWLLIL